MIRDAWHYLMGFGARNRAPVSYGNAVQLIGENAPWLDEITKRIRNARSHIGFEIYIWSDDGMGRQILEALVQAHARGVQVHGLVDAVGSWDSDKLLEDGRKAGLNLRLYHPLSFRLPWRAWHQRNHRKLMVIDGCWALVGSGNWGMDYDCAMNGNCHRDFGLVLTGPVVGDLVKDFEQAWHHAGGAQEQHEPPPTPLENFPQRESHDPLWFQDVPIQMVSSFSSGIRSIRRHFRVVIGQVRDDLLVANPYFVPDPQLRRRLERAARRGVHIDLLLPGHIDHRIVQAAARHNYPRLLRAGVQIRERMERLLHAKATVIDKEITILGSANLDMRSFRFNRELNLVLRHRGLAEAVERALIQDLASSREVTLAHCRQRPWIQRRLQDLAYALWPFL